MQPREVTRQREQPAVEVCGVNKAPERLKNGKAVLAGLIQCQPTGKRTDEVNSVQEGESQPALGRLSGMPENYPVAGKQSGWLKKEGKGIERDVESILDKLAGLFREGSCPKEEARTGASSISQCYRGTVQRAYLSPVRRQTEDIK